MTPFLVALGSVLAVNALATVRDAPVTLYPDGVYDLRTSLRAAGGRRLNLFRWLPAGSHRAAVRSTQVVLGVHLVAVVVLATGRATAVAAAVAFVTLASIHQRNPRILNSADAVARLLLCWTVVAALHRWGLFLVQFQMAVIYLRTGWWKLQGDEWRRGTAVYFALTSPDLRRHAVPRWLDRDAGYRALTWGTVAFELAIAVLIWFEPLVWPLLAAAVVFHLGLAWFLRIRLFPWVMLAGLTAFWP